MKKLCTYGMDRYEYRDIYEKREFQNIWVQNGIDEEGTPYGNAQVAVYVDDEEQSLMYLLCDQDEVEVRVRIKDVLAAPVTQHEEVGTVSYYLNGTLIKQSSVVTEESVEERTFGFICTYLLQIFLP